MRKLLNKLLAPTGYRIERISRFERELRSLIRRPERSLKFVQSGANDGMRCDDLYGFVMRHPCSGIVVEPLPDLFERLRANYADYPLIVPVNKARGWRGTAIARSSRERTRLFGGADGSAHYQRTRIFS